MIGRRWIFLSSLLILPACTGGGEANNVAAGNEAAAENGAAADNGAAAPETAATGGNASAAAAPGPCPFETRNWRATLDTSPMDNRRMITIRGEVKGDAQGRHPGLAQQPPTPPDLVLSLESDPMASPEDGSSWSEVGMGYDYDAGYTHAVVRCAGREIARVPVPRG
ncbi:MAG TPA: hypothetical protein VF702_14025 [Allosphingosinicella sp.]|jgi:hypothetical protein